MESNTHTQCPACRAPGKTSRLGSYEDPLSAASYETLLCGACGLEFAWPMKNPGPEWYQAYEDRYGYRGEDDFLHRHRLRALAELGRPRAGARLLDIGCGYGSFLLAAEKLGYEVFGVDFDERRVAAAARAGLKNVKADSIEGFISSGAGRGGFDVVTAFQFLEHMEDPGAFLSQLRGLLAPGGRLLLDIPNRRRAFSSVSGEVDKPPHHLTRWTSGSLRGLLGRSGFETEKIKDDEYPVANFYSNVFFWLTTNLLGLLKKFRTVKAASPAAAKGNTAGAPAGGRGSRQRLIEFARLAFLAAAIPLTIPLVYPLILALRASGRGLFILALARDGGPGPAR